MIKKNSAKINDLEMGDVFQFADQTYLVIKGNSFLKEYYHGKIVCVRLKDGSMAYFSTDSSCTITKFEATLELS